MSTIPFCTMSLMFHVDHHQDVYSVQQIRENVDTECEDLIGADCLVIDYLPVLE